jgi:hypothetical protein
VASPYAKAIGELGLVAAPGLKDSLVMTNGNFRLWQSEGREAVVARIAIAGDFLPAGRLLIGPDSSWGKQANRLAVHFEDVDTSFVNLEASLRVGGLVPRSLIGLGQIVSAPAAALEYLKAIHCEAIGIANNHSYDFGNSGVTRTKGEIARYDMVSVGAGQTTEERPGIFIRRGPGNLRVGFWASAKATFDTSTQNRRGVEPASVPRGLQALDAMRKQGANFCVALLHAGCMRTNRPDPEDVELMESLARSGFDVVGASHSHRIAGHRQLRGPRNRDAFCFFGLGTLVSGYVSSHLEKEGLIIVAALSSEGKLVSIEVRPVLLDHTGFGAVPSAANGAIILERFRRLSAEINDDSYRKQFYSEVSQGLGELYMRDAAAAFRSAGVRGLAHKVSRVRMRHLKRLIHKVAG